MQDGGLFLKADISVPAAGLAVTWELTGARRTLAEEAPRGDDLAAAHKGARVVFRTARGRGVFSSCG